MATTSTPLLDPRAPTARSSSHGGYVPYVVLATALVAVVPVAIAWALRGAGVVTSPWACLGIAVALSLIASRAGSAYWKKRRGTGDLLFSDLLLWGWLWRWHLERQLASTTELLERAESPAELTVERRAQLLAQLATSLEAQDAYLTGHSRRVARHSAMIAQKMGIVGPDATRIRAAAAIHDVGKLHVPKELLDKPGRLTDDEFEAIKRHAAEGAAMVAPLGDPELTGIVRHHHERFDGTGYPDRVAGEAIPLGARIIAVADTFDALTSARPYRGPSRHQDAIGVLVAGSGSQLDPEVVRAFLRYYSGNRFVLLWATLTATAQRALAWITGDTAAAGTTSAGKLVAAMITTAAIGAVAASPPVASHAAAPGQSGGEQASAPAPAGQASRAAAAPTATSAHSGTGGFGAPAGGGPVLVASAGSGPGAGGGKPGGAGKGNGQGTPRTSILGVSTNRGGGRSHAGPGSSGSESTGGWRHQGGGAGHPGHPGGGPTTSPSTPGPTSHPTPPPSSTPSPPPGGGTTGSQPPTPPGGGGNPGGSGGGDSGGSSGGGGGGSSGGGGSGGDQGGGGDGDGHGHGHGHGGGDQGGGGDDQGGDGDDDGGGHHHHHLPWHP